MTVAVEFMPLTTCTDPWDKVPLVKKEIMAPPPKLGLAMARPDAVPKTVGVFDCNCAQLFPAESHCQIPYVLFDVVS